MKHFTENFQTALCGAPVTEPCEGPVDCHVCVDLWSGRILFELDRMDAWPWPCR
jgi:hypothetical protein